MTQTRWTPGPWFIDNISETSIAAKDGRSICSTGGYADNRKDPALLSSENSANAHLIAAAPLMYEALEASAKALDDWLNTYAHDLCDARRVDEAMCRIVSHGGTLAYIADIQSKNREALRTARGETQEQSV